MGIFRRRKDAPQPSDRIEWVASTARRILAERGIEATIAHGDQPEDVTLVAAGGQRYPLFNAVAKTQGATAEEAAQLIAAHIDSLLDVEGVKSPEQLSAEQLRRQVRTRILPAAGAGPNEPTFGYARPFGDRLIVALCVDFPRSVHFITDDNLHGLALNVEDLYAFGQLNTDQEPVDERFEPLPGIQVISGDSLFTASKAANLPATIGTAPFGTLFTVPHRHMLIVLPITGPDTLEAVEGLVGATMGVLNNGLPPGGVLSPDIHFSLDGEVSRISSLDEAGTVSIQVDARLHQALEEAGR